MGRDVSILDWSTREPIICVELVMPTFSEWYFYLKSSTNARRTLTIKVDRAADLLGTDFNKLSDPFIIIDLIGPYNNHQIKTKVIKEELNPEWSEMFEFQKIRVRILCLTI